MMNNSLRHEGHAISVLLQANAKINIFEVSKTEVFVKAANKNKHRSLHGKVTAPQ